MTGLCAVIDVGKSNVKLHVVDAGLNCHDHRSRPNEVAHHGSYPHYDVDALWRWMLDSLRDIAGRCRIDSISVTTHGAAAALVSPLAGESGLVLPVMDYEFDGVASETDYDRVRPPFSDTFSPLLPSGLNLGRQLFWQRRYCAQGFESARYLLPYPQYWAWRLSGVPVAEVTSWGCHTDLWAPRARDYSALVDVLGLREKLPPLVAADTAIGTLTPAVVEQTGLSAQCRVYAGLHDSNASYLRYLSRRRGASFTVISTGTWVVSFSSSTTLDQLDERRDMLANVDVNGNPVACARFMGGREFDAICQRTGAQPGDCFDRRDLQRLLDDRVLALPDFSDGSGPFGGRRAEIRGRAGNGAALASLYCALLLDYELDLLRSTGDLLIEGAWLKNPLMCAVLAQLRPGQRVCLSNDETGTVNGAAQLVFGAAVPGPKLQFVAGAGLGGLDEYRHAWRSELCSRDLAQ